MDDEKAMTKESACAGQSSGGLAEALRNKLDEDQLTNCMRCGFCLPACPTFRETGLEAESPRGRIALMKAAVDGLIEPDAAFENQMNHCLGCRACEPACPADVKYGQLIEQARDAVEDHTKQHRAWVRAVRALMFKHIFPYHRRMRMLGLALKIVQRSGLRRLLRFSGFLSLFPKHVRNMERILPDAENRGVYEQMGDLIPAQGQKIARVAMFRGCIMDVLFTETNKHTVRLLTEAGFEVVIPPAQACCGALHAHSGEAEQARALARRNIAAFEESKADYVVSNAGGCGAMLIDYDHALARDPEWKDRAQRFREQVIDVSELLVNHGRMQKFSAKKGTEGRPLRITYQDSCHQRNVMKAGEAPRRLMQQVAHTDFIELHESDRCCGSAGIYNITQPDMAGKLLDHKMDHVEQTDAAYLITSNPGCLLQMKSGAEQRGMSGPIKVLHLVDFLYESRL